MAKRGGKIGGFVQQAQNMATKAASNVYTKDMIAQRAASGSHNGEAMHEIFTKIMNDPKLERRATKTDGMYDLIYHDDDQTETNIGWMDSNRGIGNINQKGYDKLELPPDFYDRANGGFDDEDCDYNNPDYDDSDFEDPDLGYNDADVPRAVGYNPREESGAAETKQASDEAEITDDREILF